MIDETEILEAVVQIDGLIAIRRSRLTSLKSPKTEETPTDSSKEVRAEIRVHKQAINILERLKLRLADYSKKSLEDGSRS